MWGLQTSSCLRSNCDEVKKTAVTKVLNNKHNTSNELQNTKARQLNTNPPPKLVLIKYTQADITSRLEVYSHFLPATKQHVSAVQFSTIQEKHRILGNLKSYHRAHKSQPILPILSHTNSVQSLVILIQDPFLYNPPIYAKVF